MLNKSTGALLLIASILIGALIISGQTSTKQENSWIEGLVVVKDEEGNLKTPPKVKGWSNFTGYVKVYQKGKAIAEDSIDMSGVFIVDNVQTGTYNLLVELPEYKVAIIRGVDVRAVEPTVLEIVLSEKGVGWQESVTTTFEVTPSAFNKQLETFQKELTEIKTMLKELLQRK